jgi:hypothetical protein
LARRALLVGIDDYQSLGSLTGCVADAKAMHDLLETNEDGSPNYDCRLLTSAQAAVTRKLLRASWIELFENFEGDVLFHFSGHGTPTKVGGFLATSEGDKEEPGLPMDELLLLANDSKARSVLLILDCCHAGHMGNPAILQSKGSIENQAQLREGVTILAASRPGEPSFEEDGHGVFTNLVLGALGGGAADIRGRVSAASIYAYAEQALGSWDQRPMYKSHADRLAPVRRCEPAVSDSLLRELPKIFMEANSPFQMDPSYEHTHPSANPDHVKIFDKFKLLRNARLLVTEENRDLYFIALGSGWVRLSSLGQFYWKLAKGKRI